MNDKDRPMPPLIAFAGAVGGLRRGPLGATGRRRGSTGSWKKRGCALAEASRPSEIRRCAATP